MIGSPLSLLIFCPLAGAIAVGLLSCLGRGNAHHVAVADAHGAQTSSDDKFIRMVAIFFGAVTFGLSVALLRVFDRQATEFQLMESVPWVPEFGVRYAVGIDGLSLTLIILTTFLTLLVLLASSSVHKKLGGYLVCMLFLETGLLGALCALDGITFYVFWELMLIPMYFLIGIWGGNERIYAAIKFVLYTAFGSLLMLVAIVYLAYAYGQSHSQMSFALADWTTLRLSTREELWLFSAFALAFAIKIPVFPFHTWLPDAHVQAPTGGSVILAGVLLKLGLYGLIRFCVPIFPHATVVFAPIFVALGVIGIVYGALVAWVQTDMKKLVAYSSVSHLGFCVLGFGSLNLQGMQGSILQMLNHGVSTAALFFLVGVLYDRKHTRMIADYGGLASKTPLFAVVFLIFTLSSIGLPLTNGFVGEFLILLSGYKYNPWVGGIAVTGVVFGAMYMLSLYRRVAFGEINEQQNGDLTDLNLTERVIFTPLILLVFVMGVYPQPILDLTHPVAASTLARLSDRRPAADRRSAPPPSMRHATSKEIEPTQEVVAMATPVGSELRAQAR